MLIEVDDPTDQRLAEYLDLRHSPERATVIVEGTTALEQVEGSRFALRSVLCLERHVPRVVALAGAVPVYVAPVEVLRATVGFDLHRGVVASCERPTPLTECDVTRGARLLVALERLNDLENVGVVFRSCRALGADGVLLDAQTPDPLNRRTVRVSLGHVLRVPFARSAAWPPALEGFTTVALTPGGEVDLRELADVERAALLVGAEGDGLTDAALQAADIRCRIPMAHGVDSLNVATATAIALYELQRGRR